MGRALTTPLVRNNVNVMIHLCVIGVPATSTNQRWDTQHAKIALHADPTSTKRTRAPCILTANVPRAPRAQLMKFKVLPALLTSIQGAMTITYSVADVAWGNCYKDVPLTARVNAIVCRDTRVTHKVSALLVPTPGTRQPWVTTLVYHAVFARMMTTSIVSPCARAQSVLTSTH